MEKNGKFIIISLILTTIILSIFTFPVGEAFADHIDQRKFAVLDEYSFTEVKGIVADADAWNGDIFLSPDPNYHNLLLEGNTIAPGPSDNAYPRWKGLQDELKYNCSLPTDRNYPIIRLELYGFDMYNRTGWGLPVVSDTGLVVTECDHISVRGLYVIDHGHTMYAEGGMTPAFCYDYIIVSLPGPDYKQRACKPHAELHPYQWQSVNLSKPPPANIFNPNVETHTVVVPFYNEFFGEETKCYVVCTPIWDCVYPSEGGRCNQVIDEKKRNGLIEEWYIQAGPHPSGGQCGVRSGDRCEIRYEENVLLKTGNVSAQITPESSGIRVQVHATDLTGSDYDPLPDTGIPGSYKLKSPSQYIARYSVWWVPATGPPPPPQQQQPPT